MSNKLSVLLLLACLAPGSVAQACTVCRPQVEAGIYNATYSANALVLLLPVLLLVAGSLLLFYSPTLASWKTSPPRRGTTPHSWPPAS
ncbi:hypothetical protein LGH70_21755 [Hymenobacter sp. BT635]|uniref:Uncharacterized protein n=1 Tax=Hymenobacter nitidus TaxID=2880929 RepID=A0ABS8AKM9_9BACT|nr:hypothetical protein [Hymenobacter nitidus]MCB2380232.1 hypothetical protein [Hymenobacter nitidus]